MIGRYKRSNLHTKIFSVQLGFKIIEQRDKITTKDFKIVLFGSARHTVNELPLETLEVFVRVCRHSSSDNPTLCELSSLPFLDS